MVLRASVALTAIAAPTKPMPAARLADPARAAMTEASRAVSATPVARTRFTVPSPSMKARTVELIVFSDHTPAALKPMPAPAPAPTAAARAVTSAPITWPAVASMVSGPEAETEVSCR